MDESYELPADDADLLGECDVSTFRASGPGGQSVNTSDSAVRLVHRPTGIVVVCRRERSQLLNKRACLARLRGRILERQREAERPPRVKTKPTRAANRRRLAAKTELAAKKRARAKPDTVEE